MDMEFEYLLMNEGKRWPQMPITMCKASTRACNVPFDSIFYGGVCVCLHLQTLLHRVIKVILLMTTIFFLVEFSLFRFCLSIAQDHWYV